MFLIEESEIILNLKTRNLREKRQPDEIGNLKNVKCVWPQFILIYNWLVLDRTTRKK